MRLVRSIWHDGPEVGDESDESMTVSGVLSSFLSLREGEEVSEEVPFEMLDLLDFLGF